MPLRLLKSLVTTCICGYTMYLHMYYICMDATWEGNSREMKLTCVLHRFCMIQGPCVVISGWFKYTRATAELKQDMSSKIDTIPVFSDVVSL